MKCAFTIVILLWSSTAIGQFLSYDTLSLPPGNIFTAIAADSVGTIIIADDLGKLYRSTDSGETWDTSYPGGPYVQAYNTPWLAVAADSSFLLVSGNADHGAAYRSTDRGISWTWLSAWGAGSFGSVKFLEDSQGRLWLNGLQYKQKDSTTWSYISSPPPFPNYTYDFTVTSKGTLIIETDSGLMRTTDLGKHWTTSWKNDEMRTLWLLQTYDGIFAYTPEGAVYANLSVDDGVTFQPIALSYSSFNGYNSGQTYLELGGTSNANLYALRDSSVFHSHDGGQNWALLNNLPRADYLSTGDGNGPAPHIARSGNFLFFMTGNWDAHFNEPGPRKVWRMRLK